MTVYFQPVQDVQISTRVEPRAVPVHAGRHRRRRGLRLVATAGRAAAARSPVLRDVASRGAGRRPARCSSRSTARRPAASASPCRRSTTRSTRLRPAPDLDHLRPGQPVPRRSWRRSRSTSSDPAAPGAALRALDAAGAQVPLELPSRRSSARTAPLVDQPPGAVPSGDHQLQPGARRLAQRCRVAPSTTAAARRSACRRRSSGSYFGRRRRVRASSLAGQPWLILAAVVTIYIVLGVLYESFIHPFTILSTLPSAGVGALLALMLAGHGPLARSR